MDWDYDLWLGGIYLKKCDFEKSIDLASFLNRPSLQAAKLEVWLESSP